eukprot:gene14096-18915_t
MSRLAGSSANWFEVLFGVTERNILEVRKNFIHLPRFPYELGLHPNNLEPVQTNQQDILEFAKLQKSSVTGISEDDQYIYSCSNNKFFKIGKFSTPTLHQLRKDVSLLMDNMNENKSTGSKSSTSFRHIIAGDVFPMHAKFPNALFQAASQFNCLEFTSSKTVPENGISIYAYDNTQGPACAMACAAGTLYRNYFVPVLNHADNTLDIGQTRDNQINNLDLVEELLDNKSHQYWDVENGYTFTRDPKKLLLLNEKLKALSHEEYENLLGNVKIGLHENVGVNFDSRFNALPSDIDIHVTQAYCSALSCSYSGVSPKYWEGLGKLVLNASYESTLLAAVKNALKNQDSNTNNTSGITEKNGDGSISSNETQSHRKDVFLTFLGGGVFGNPDEWIANAIGRAIAIVSKQNVHLNIYICHYRNIDEDMVQLIEMFYEQYMKSDTI